MIEQNNVSSGITIGQMVRQLSKAYISLIQSHTPFRCFPSVMLWGPPGVGKSQGIRQLAADISEKTDRKVQITDLNYSKSSVFASCNDDTEFTGCIQFHFLYFGSLFDRAEFHFPPK